MGRGGGCFRLSHSGVERKGLEKVVSVLPSRILPRLGGFPSFLISEGARQGQGSSNALGNGFKTLKVLLAFLFFSSERLCKLS